MFLGRVVRIKGDSGMRSSSELCWDSHSYGPWCGVTGLYTEAYQNSSRALNLSISGEKIEL